MAKNSYGIHEHAVTASVESFDASLSDADFGVKSTSIEKATGKVSIADADVVVSAGRGLKAAQVLDVMTESIHSNLGCCISA